MEFLNRMKWTIAVSALALAIGHVPPADAQVTHNTAEYNLTSKVALKGYDPVSFFPEGSGTPLLGQQQFALDYLGAVYMFANAANMKTFGQNPEKYEPTYGGWCAYAMASGSKVDIQPTLYTINGNRLHFFVSNRAKRNFDADVSGFETRADDFWKQISGELPRL